MKLFVLLTVGVSLAAATPATSATPTRDQLDTKATDHARKAAQKMQAASDAFSAGNLRTGCGAVRQAQAELVDTIHLLDREANLVRDDQTLSDPDRTQQQQEITNRRNGVVHLQTLAAQMAQHCA